MANLRQRRHAQTRSDIVTAAFQLFAEHGFAAVTMEQIARASGVSRSTAYRRFATKEDVVLDVPRRWLQVWDDAVVQLGDDVGAGDAMAEALLAVARHIDDDRATILTVYRVLAEVPSLATSSVATVSWLERAVLLIAERSTLDDEAATVAAGAYLGGIDAMMTRWAAAGGRAPVEEATHRVVDRLRPILLRAEPSARSSLGS